MPQQVKVYKAIFTQSGTDAPTVREIENSIGVITIAKSLEQDNWIDANSNGLFTQGKTFLPQPHVDFEAATAATNFMQAGWKNSSKIVFAPQFAADGSSGYLNGAAYVEIIVYP